MITSEKLRKKEFEGLFSTKSLRWILRILLRLKHSSWCGGSVASNDGSWWPPMVVGGGGGGVRARCCGARRWCLCLGCLFLYLFSSLLKFGCKDLVTMTIIFVFLQCISFPLMTNFALYVLCVRMLPLSFQRFVLVVVWIDHRDMDSVGSKTLLM